MGNSKKVRQVNKGSARPSSSRQVRKKRTDTKMRTIEKKYGKDYRVRSDKKLGNHLKEQGYKSLSELIKKS